MGSIQGGACGKTSLARCPLQSAGTSDKSSKVSSESRKNRQLFLCRIQENSCQRGRYWETITHSRGASSTRNTTESPSAAAVCLLSSILTEAVPERFSLSPKACQGILRRAEKRGKSLPEVLRMALMRQSGESSS